MFIFSILVRHKRLIAVIFPWGASTWTCSAAESDFWVLEVMLVFTTSEFSIGIGGKVFFTSARRLPWVLPMPFENLLLRCLQWRLCFVDAFVYRIRGLWQHFKAKRRIFATNMLIYLGDGFEC
jgi:hypothetical protein